MITTKNLAKGDHIEVNGVVHVIAHANITITTPAGSERGDRPFKGSMTACRLSTRRERREVTDADITCITCLVWDPEEYARSGRD